MRDGHADRRFDLLGGCAAHGAIRRRGRNRPMNDVIDFVRFEAEDLSQPTPDFIQQHHPAQCVGAILVRQLRGCDGDGIEIVVAELARGVTELGVVAEVCPVGIPLAHRGTVGEDRLLRRKGFVRSKYRHAPAPAPGNLVAERLLAQNGRSVRSQRDRGQAADHAIGEKHQRAN